jgi:hypothetical protein
MERIFNSDICNLIHIELIKIYKKEHKQKFNIRSIQIIKIFIDKLNYYDHGYDGIIYKANDVYNLYYRKKNINLKFEKSIQKETKKINTFFNHERNRKLFRILNRIKGTNPMSLKFPKNDSYFFRLYEMHGFYNTVDYWIAHCITKRKNNEQSNYWDLISRRGK